MGPLLLRYGAALFGSARTARGQRCDKRPGSLGSSLGDTFLHHAGLLSYACQQYVRDRYQT